MYQAVIANQPAVLSEVAVGTGSLIVSAHAASRVAGPA
jgi:hypothetical protein